MKRFNGSPRSKMYSKDGTSIDKSSFCQGSIQPVLEQSGGAGPSQCEATNSADADLSVGLSLHQSPKTEVATVVKELGY